MSAEVLDPFSEAFYLASLEAGLTREDQLLLTEVDHLLVARYDTMEFDGAVSCDVLTNLSTAVQEAAMPYAVTRTEHEVVYDRETGKRTFQWLGRTAVANAMSGYGFHALPAALDRVAVEVDEAEHASESLRPGEMHVFLSPRMSAKDAELEDARREHLGDDDAVRVSWLETTIDGKQKRVMKSLLVRDMPLRAWTDMLADPCNIFGAAVEVEDPESALSVMQTHRSLVVPMATLPDGPVTLVEQAARYIEDPKLREHIATEAVLYYSDQDSMQRKAVSVAERWLDFEQALTESVYTTYAHDNIIDFVRDMAPLWNDEHANLLERHMIRGELRMSRSLAAMLERAKRNLLWASAASTVDNKQVERQIDPVVHARIRDNETLIQLAKENGVEYRQLEAENNRLVGSQNIKVGAGCPGDNQANFRAQKDDEGPSEKKFMNCPHCNGKVYDDPCAKILVCGGCHAFVINGHTWSKGNGGRQRKEELRQEKIEKREAEIAASAAKLAMVGVSSDV